MATQNNAYDAPVYQGRPVVGASLSGSGGNTKFVAFTDMLVKSYSLKPTTAGTSNDVFSAYKLTGTTTTTHAITTYGSAATGGTNVAGTFTLAQGDCLTVAKGTDATGVYGVGVELVIVPGANVTA